MTDIIEAPKTDFYLRPPSAAYGVIPNKPRRVWL